jgi:LacI family transcriptional regulator
LLSQNVLRKIAKRWSVSHVSNLKQLAQALGLSITTVSRALDGYPDVAQATRERVLAAARSMDYRPNSAARNLRRKRVETVVVTLPSEPGHFGPPVFMDMLAACGQRLAEEGLDLMLVPTVSRHSEMETYRASWTASGRMPCSSCARTGMTNVSLT